VAGRARQLNRLATLTNSLTGQFGFGYDALNRRTQLTRPNGINTNYGYDSVSRLLSVLVGNRLSSLGVPTYSCNSSNQLTSNSNGSYTYDNNGNTLTDASVRIPAEADQHSWVKPISDRRAQER